MLAIANQDPQGGSILCGEAYPLNQVFLDEIMGAAPIDEDDDNRRRVSGAKLPASELKLIWAVVGFGLSGDSGAGSKSSI